MANPNETQIRAQIDAAVDLLESTFQFGHATTPNLIDKVDALTQALHGDYSETTADAAAAVRAAVAAALEEGQRLLDPLLLAYAKFYKLPETSSPEILQQINRIFADAGQTIQTRAFVFGTPVPDGANVGDGTVRRLTVDRNGFPLEGCFAETKQPVCIADVNSGAASGQEQFEVRGGKLAKDGLILEGSGIAQTINARNGADAAQILQNPSFDQFDGDSIAVLSSIPGWTPTNDIANFELDETDFYRGYVGDGGTPRSLKIKATDSVTQNLTALGRNLDPDTPYYLQVAFNREVGGATGTLRIDLGGVTTNVALAAQTGWNVLFIPLGTNNWHKVFNADPLNVVVDFTRTAGELLVDDVVLVPMDLVDGTYMSFIGGATRFLRGDSFQWDDTETGAKIQTWFWRLYDEILPASGTPTWSDP